MKSKVLHAEAEWSGIIIRHPMGHDVKVQNRGPENENPGRDLRKTDSTKASILTPRLVC